MAREGSEVQLGALLGCGQRRAGGLFLDPSLAAAAAGLLPPSSDERPSVASRWVVPLAGPGRSRCFRGEELLEGWGFDVVEPPSPAHLPFPFPRPEASWLLSHAMSEAGWSLPVAAMVGVGSVQSRLL